MTENGIKENGIYKLNGYTFWSKVEVVENYVMNDLKEKFPNSLIVPELNRIDLAVISENLPVEIQTTQVSNDAVHHTQFEDKIRKQIEDNIENYEKCLFYFDAEYYRYLNESASSNTSINLDWLAKYVKENKLKIIAVKYNGEIKELKYEDLSFIRKLSNTCKIEYESDKRILNRNKLKIINSILIGHKFTQNEIHNFTYDYNTRTDKASSMSNFLMKEKDERKNIYGRISYSMGHLEWINDILNMNENYEKGGKRLGSHLGIFKLYGHGGSDNRMEFKDYFNICQYFPGYTRNEKIWNELRYGSFSDRQLRDIFFVKNKQNKQKTMVDYK